MSGAMIQVLEPNSELLRLFVDSIYVFKKGPDKLEFTAYPGINTPVALLRNAVPEVEGNHVCIRNTDSPCYSVMVCNQFSDKVHLRYEQLADEIAINFKPLGFTCFTGAVMQRQKVFGFPGWDRYLPDLFSDVFNTDDPQQQLSCIETFLQEQYRPPKEEQALLQALVLLNDTARDYKIEEIASRAGLHHKQLYRSFSEYVGCSPAHYRKLLRFRRSVIDKVGKGAGTKLTDISYTHDYTDQAYFNRQFKELTGEKPGRFFKEVTSFGNAKVIFKID